MGGRSPTLTCFSGRFSDLNPVVLSANYCAWEGTVVSCVPSVCDDETADIFDQQLYSTYQRTIPRKLPVNFEEVEKPVFSECWHNP